MFKIILDVRELEFRIRHLRYDPSELAPSISLYLTKSYSIPTVYKPGYPAKLNTVSFDVLDEYFTSVGFSYLIQGVEELNKHRRQLVSIEIKNSYLTIEG